MKTLVVLVSMMLSSIAAGSDRWLTAADAAAGKPLYLRECSGCHGERGDGAGPAAEFLDPRPRDFTKRAFKFRTTPSGQPPTTRDVKRTIDRGIPGTAMPSFAFLPGTERWKITAYVLKLADMLDEPEPRAMPPPGTPPPGTPETIAHGKQIYADAACDSCHGALGKGDGPSAGDLRDAEGRPSPPRDFTAGVFRGGGERMDLAYRIITGMDGTPMPGFGDAIAGADLWGLVDYVMSIRAPVPITPHPADPITAGRQVVARFGCIGCHALDDGRGGDVGPDLRVSGQKLSPEWVRHFLQAPRAYGKIYPFRVYRMPRLALAADDVEVLTRYIAAMGKRPDGPLRLPDAAAFPAERVEQGKLLFMLRCTECHNLGTVIETPPIKQQGPDLIHVADRVDYDWARAWILDPKKIDPKSRMTVPGLTPEDVDAVRMFIWKTSMTSGSPRVAAGTSTP
jgi:cytochrome c oxidase cbb3-type subunit 2